MMLEIFGHQIGTVLQAITAALVALGIWWIRGWPERRRAENATATIDHAQMAAVIADYAKRQQETRNEVHDLRNEMQVMQGRLNRSEKISSQRSDRINNMMFIIRLLISDLKRLDPNSQIVQQAEMILRHVSEADETDDPLSSAHDTVKAAQHTVDRLEGKE